MTVNTQIPTLLRVQHTEGCSRGTQRGQGPGSLWFWDGNGYATENEVSRGRSVGLGHTCISVAQRPSNGPAPRAQKDKRYCRLKWREKVKYINMKELECRGNVERKTDS